MAIVISNFGLLIAEVLILTGIALILHYASSRYGISLLLMYVATIVGILTYAEPMVIFLEPIPNIILTIPADIFIPTILTVILVLYVVDGTEIAQVVIFGIALTQLVVGIIFIITSLTTYLPTASVAVSEVVFTDVLQVNLRVMFAAIISFIVDMFVVAFLYQGVCNVLKRPSSVMATGIALIGALWTDAIVFNIVASIGHGGFAEFIPGDIISKSVTALALFPLVAFYLNQYAPQIPLSSGKQTRSTFDIFHNLFGHWQFKIASLEAEIRDTEINTQHLINHIHEIFWMAEHGDGQSYFINPAFDSILGIKRGDYYLNPDIIYDIIHEDDIEVVKEQWLTYTEQNHDIEFRIMEQEGEIRWLRDRAYRVQDKQLNIDRVIGITEDITSHKERQVLQIAIEAEQEKIKFLHELIREVSHDVQSPITSLSLKIDLLERVKGDTEREKKYLIELKKQTLQLSQLMEHLFTLIKFESRSSQLDEICSFKEVCQDVFDELYPFANDKQITINLKLPNTPALVRCNPTELRRVVTNLIGNGIRYTYNKGTVDIEMRTTDQSIIFSVRDTGIGISEQDLPHIFERFYRATNTQDIHGTGLGLAITKQIIQRIGGTIQVKSELNTGTTFIITVPSAK